MDNHGGKFQGTDRFKIRREIDTGGMGIVYEVFDRDLDETVALKTIRTADPSLLYRLRKEFRALADVFHPNLVVLYELLAEDNDWFFTMEMIRGGINFLQYIRKRAAVDSRAETLVDEIKEHGGVSKLPVPSLNCYVDEARLRKALRQLAAGIFALHQIGKLHRDIKPSNVLITEEGRVVILDLGLVTEIAAKDQSDTDAIRGTPEYMSPEQAIGQKLTEATDWYSMGVVLYEVLTGQLPITGKRIEIIIKKQSVVPVSPSELKPRLIIPEDLNALCVELLRIDPEARPQASEILRRLHVENLEYSSSALSVVIKTPFIGREYHRQMLQEAFLSTQRDKRTMTVYIHGHPGVGKSALVRHFLDGLGQDEQKVVILEGRCYEQESIPYKALDSVVDSLSKYLRSTADAHLLMPDDMFALCRVFPVMRLVDSVNEAVLQEQDIPDPFELRRRAFESLRQLLVRISKRQLLVLYIDDLQWADADSTALLEDLLRPPDPPPLLLIGSFRRKEVANKLFLERLLEHTGSETCLSLPIDKLTDDEARQLVAHTLLNSEIPAIGQLIESIVREAGGSQHISQEPKIQQLIEAIISEANGNPFLIEQLTHYALESQGGATTGISLADMLEARLRRLPDAARQLLKTLAVAGRPINVAVACQATALGPDRYSIVAMLRASRFVSSETFHRIEFYHDRIRETLKSSLKENTIKEMHQRLAETLEERGIDDPEALYDHHLGARNLERAAVYAKRAAEKATAALAFDRAAELYQRALNLATTNCSDLVELNAHLGYALANAGRPAPAAQYYLEAAEGASRNSALDYRRRAAEQLLMGGYIDMGTDVIRGVLKEVGLKWASGPKGALNSLRLQRAKLWLHRGLEYQERKESECDKNDLLRIDICWSVAAGLGSVDNIRGADFQTRHLLLALQAGEPYRVARALAMEAGFSALRGGPAQKRSEKIIEKAELLARKVDNPHAIGLTTAMAGIAAFLFGQWKDAARKSLQAEEILREKCTGVMWEIASAQRFQLSSLMYMGELKEMSRRLPILLAMAEERGNLFASTSLRARINIVKLAADEPQLAVQEVTRALNEWTQEGFHLQHYYHLFSMTQNELYMDNGEAAWRRIRARWKDLQRSLLLRIQVLRVEAMHLQARCALAVALRHKGAKPQLIAIARRLAKEIAQEKMHWATPLAWLICAGIASVENTPSEAANLLDKAVTGFDKAEMCLYASAARWRLGALTGGDRGNQLVSEARAWMLGQEIRKPVSMIGMLAPGFVAAVNE